MKCYELLKTTTASCALPGQMHKALSELPAYQRPVFSAGIFSFRPEERGLDRCEWEHKRLHNELHVVRAHSCAVGLSWLRCGGNMDAGFWPEMDSGVWQAEMMDLDPYGSTHAACIAI